MEQTRMWQKQVELLIPCTIFFDSRPVSHSYITWLRSLITAERNGCIWRWMGWVCPSFDGYTGSLPVQSFQMSWLLAECSSAQRHNLKFPWLDKQAESTESSWPGLLRSLCQTRASANRTTQGWNETCPKQTLCFWTPWDAASKK